MESDEAFQKWKQAQEGVNKISTLKTNAWVWFIKQFPNVNRSKSVAQVYVDEKHHVSAKMFFKEGPCSLQSVFGSDREYWSKNKNALGVSEMKTLHSEEGFPYQLSPVKTKTVLPIPAVDFTKAAPSLEKTFNNPINIYMTPDTLCPGIWLMPARMIVNIESIVG